MSKAQNSLPSTIIVIDDEDDSDISESDNQETKKNNKEASQEINSPQYSWSDEEDIALINEILLQARYFLNSEELSPEELEKIMNTIEKAIRRKRINLKGYDSMPVSEINRQLQEEEEEEEATFPVANLRPGTNVDAL